MVLGSSSPKKYQLIEAAQGFAGEGWYIQAQKRLLLCGDKWVRVWEMPILCNRPDCCDGLPPDKLSTKEFNVRRAIHNLLEIENSLAQTKISKKQLYLTSKVWS